MGNTKKKKETVKMSFYYVFLFLMFVVINQQTLAIETRLVALNDGASPKNLQELSCDVCYDFFSCCLDDVINVILNGGTSSCSEICKYLPKSLYQGVCDVLCVAVGVGAFIALLKNSDTYPINLCLQLDQCTPNHCKDKCGDIKTLSLTPKSAQTGSTFDLAINFNAFQTSGFALPCPAGLYKGSVSVCAGDCLDSAKGLVLDRKEVQFELNDSSLIESTESTKKN